MANDFLGNAKAAKNDEFYTQFDDIQKEMNAYLDFNLDVFRGKTILLPCDDPEWSNFTRYFAQNFQTLGLKKLISTSFAPNSKPLTIPFQPTLFEMDSPDFDEVKTQANGKIFTLTGDITGDDVINVDDLQWSYLDGDGDFRSDEITALRDEADVIITNPPFSLFRQFLNWIIEAEKNFVIVGNQNAITYKEVFPRVKANKIWLGKGFTRNMAHFYTPYAPQSRWIEQEGDHIVRVPGIQWFTNLDHGRRHEPLSLMTEEDNFRYSKHKEVKGIGYRRYDNYDAIEVPFTDAIPSDFDGVMGVPITFLSKYNPDQFEILGMCENADLYGLKTRNYKSSECKAAYLKKFGKPGTYDLNASGVLDVNGQLEKVYQRILIRHRKAPS